MSTTSLSLLNRAAANEPYAGDGERIVHIQGLGDCEVLAGSDVNLEVVDRAGEVQRMTCVLQHELPAGVLDQTATCQMTVGPKEKVGRQQHARGRCGRSRLLADDLLFREVRSLR